MTLLPRFLSSKLSATVKNTLLGLAVACTLSPLLPISPVHATQLPPGVLQYIHQKDKYAQVRFDGVVIFSNGATYLPVIPQDAANPDPMAVVHTLPEKTDYPELVQFDNNFFLIKILQTSSGRLTLPKLTNVPVQLKEGLLPQDLVMPNHLYIPDELKIILGELPYNPSLETASPKVTAAQSLKNTVIPKNGVNTNEQNQRVLYAYDMDRQLLVTIDAFSQKPHSTLSLGCMPASMLVSPDGKYLYAGCLSSDEVVTVDLSANLIKARIPVGSKPQDLLLLQKSGYLAVANRFDKTLSLINTKDLLPATKEFQVSLPGRPGVMLSLTPRQILIADAYQNQIYQLDLSTRKIERTITTLPNISAMYIHTPNQGRPELWVVSRSENKVQVLDLVNESPLATLDVGEKPAAIAALHYTRSPQALTGVSSGELPVDKLPTQKLADSGNVRETRLYVLCSGSDRLDVLNPYTYGLQESIQLPEGLFPTNLSVVPVDQRAYVAGAGKEGITVVDLSRNQLDEAIAVPFRIFSLSLPLHSDVHTTGMTSMMEKNDPDKNPISADKKQSDKNMALSPLGNSEEASFQIQPVLQEEASNDTPDVKKESSLNRPLQRFRTQPSGTDSSDSGYSKPTVISVPSTLSVQSTTQQPGAIRFGSTPSGSKGVQVPLNQLLHKKKSSSKELPMMELENKEGQQTP